MPRRARPRPSPLRLAPLGSTTTAAHLPSRPLVQRLSDPTGPVTTLLRDPYPTPNSHSWWTDKRGPVNPAANKGGVVKYLSAKYGVPNEQIATIGDMPNDVLMFAHSGLSIAKGQSDREVQRAARRVTTSNDDEGFANAVERLIVRAHDKATLKPAERT